MSLRMWDENKIIVAVCIICSLKAADSAFVAMDVGSNPVNCRTLCFLTTAVYQPRTYLLVVSVCVVLMSRAYTWFEYRWVDRFDWKE